jgi:hypothetical protein
MLNPKKTNNEKVLCTGIEQHLISIAILTGLEFQLITQQLVFQLVGE